MNWETILKNQSSKDFIDNYIAEMKTIFIEEIQQANPTASEPMIRAEANKALIDYVKEVVLEGKEIPIPNVTQFRGENNVE